MNRYHWIGTISTAVVLTACSGGLLLGMIVPPFTFVLRRASDITSPLEELASLPLPDLEQAASMLNVAVATVGDLTIAGAGLSNQIVRLRGGRIVDSLDIPIERRRGVPADLADRFAATEPGRWMTLYSTQWMAAPLGDGLVLTHVELSPLDEPVSPPRPRFTTQSWLTVFDHDLNMACVDIALPISADLHPFIASRGDTLLVLDHHDTGGDVQTVVRKYLVNTGGCRWRPVERTGVR